MHAFLFIGNRSGREEAIRRKVAALQIQPVDQVILSPIDVHITIDQVRSFQKRIQLMPLVSGVTAGIIEDLSALTDQAAQAILKLLEEPPKHAIFLCGADSTDQLPATIVSRCVTERIPDGSGPQPETATDSMLKILLSGKTSDILSVIGDHTNDREEAKAFARHLLDSARKELVSGANAPDFPVASGRLTSVIRKLLNAQGRLAVNCNPRLVLDNVFLSP